MTRRGAKLFPTTARICEICGAEAPFRPMTIDPKAPVICAINLIVYRYSKAHGRQLESTKHAVRVCDGCLILVLGSKRSDTNIKARVLADRLFDRLGECYSKMLEARTAA